MKINLNIGEVLVTAFKIIWKFKVLWIFGILAGFGASDNTNYSNGFNTSGIPDLGNGNSDDPTPYSTFPNSVSQYLQEYIRSITPQQWMIGIIIGLILLTLAILVTYLSTIGQTSLIKGTRYADSGVQSLSFGELWDESHAYFWRMIGLKLLLALPAVVLLAFVLASVVGSFWGSGSAAAMPGVILSFVFPMLCCFGIMSAFINMIFEQAKNAMVIEDIGVFASLDAGWNIFKGNFLAIILMSIILFVINAILSFIVSIPMMMAFLPLALLFMSQSSSSLPATYLISGICVLVSLPVLLILSGIEQSYNQSVLTLTYLRLTSPAQIINVQ